MNFSWGREVNYYETDRMGVVHHSNYLRILEEARSAWLDENILSYSEIEKMGVIIPFISAVQDFKGFLRFGDRFSVEVALIKYNSVEVIFGYVVTNTTTGIECMRAQTAHCFSRDALKTGGEYTPFSIKKEYPELHEKMLGFVEKGADVRRVRL